MFSLPGPSACPNKASAEERVGKLQISSPPPSCPHPHPHLFPPVHVGFLQIPRLPVAAWISSYVASSINYWPLRNRWAPSRHSGESSLSPKDPRSSLTTISAWMRNINRESDRPADTALKRTTIMAKNHVGHTGLASSMVWKPLLRAKLFTLTPSQQQILTMWWRKSW